MKLNMHAHTLICFPTAQFVSEKANNSPTTETATFLTQRKGFESIHFDS